MQVVFVPSNLVLRPLTAILFFLILYRFLILHLVVSIETKNGIKLNMPSLKRGMIYSALIPLFVYIFVYLWIFLSIGLWGINGSLG